MICLATAAFYPAPSQFATPFGIEPPRSQLIFACYVVVGACVLFMYYVLGLIVIVATSEVYRCIARSTLSLIIVAIISLLIEIVSSK